MSPNAAQTTDAFISYSRHDRAFVERLAAALETQNRTVWWGETALSKDWQQVIHEQIANANHFIVVLSPDYVTSPDLPDELKQAIALHKPIIPIVYREGFVANLLNPVLSRLNWLFFRGEDDFQNALNALLELLSVDEPPPQYDTSSTSSETKGNAVSEEISSTPPTEFSDQPFHGHDGAVQTVVFSPDGQIIASGGDDSTIRLWTVDGNPLGRPFQGQRPSRVRSVAFSPTGETLISSGDDCLIHIWKIDGTPLIQPFAQGGYPYPIYSVAFSPNGELIASGSGEEVIRLYDQDGKSIGQAFQGHQNYVTSIAFSPDGNTLASGGADKVIFLWSLDGVQIGQAFQGHENYVTSIAFSPNGKILASASHDRTIRLWNLDGTPIGQPFEGHQEGVTSVSFSPNGQIIASGSADQTIRLWDLNGTPIGQPLNGHQGYVLSVAFSPDGKAIASGGEDGSIRLWHIQKQTRVTFVSQRLNNDLARGNDCLNIENEIHALADILAMRDVEPPLAVGILGGWGSGKSFAMHLIQQRLNQIRSRTLSSEQAWESKNNPYVGHIYQIKFDAWTYAKANLWSSLMQTIFYEFNRQLTLEKQIAEALVREKTPAVEPSSPSLSATVWQMMQQVGQQVRQQVGQQVMRMMPFGSFATDSAPQATTDLTTDAIALQQAQLEGGKIWQALNEMNEGDRAYILQSELSPEAFAGLKVSKSQQEAVDYLWKQIADLRQAEKQELVAKTKVLQQEKKNLRRLIVSQAPIYFAQKNWMFLVALVAGSVIVIYPLLPSRVKDMLPNVSKVLNENPVERILGGSFTTLLTLKSLWDKTREEQEKILAEWKKHQEEIQNQLKTAKDASTTAYQDLVQSDSKIQQQLENIHYLETQIGVQQQQMGLSPTNPSLNTFISDRLQTDSYGKQLGFLQQVQRDLADLTNHFTFPSQDDKAKEYFREKLHKLQQIFPRGPARIVLYIDDLDRCPPDQVVNVLEAVQLILKTPLFIVILAIDDRYVARALEKVYSGVLTRQGHPSGIDYLEKIIQLPYRMRPISPEGLESYLTSQIELESPPSAPLPLSEALSEPVSTIAQQTQQSAPSRPLDDHSTLISAAPSEEGSQIERRSPTSETITADSSPFSQTSVSTTEADLEAAPSPEKVPPDDMPTVLTEDIAQITKFTQAEFDIIKACCQHVDISPRTAKRLINIFKILKIVWSSAHSEPPPEIKQTIIAFLALSGRYPDFMRYAFVEINAYFEQTASREEQQAEQLEKQQAIAHLMQTLKTPFPNGDNYAQREWQRFQHDIQQMIPADLSLETLGRSPFNLILSFCFVGDIGYDPNDFAAANSNE